MPGGGIPVVQAEVALAHKLEALGILALFRHGEIGQTCLYLAAFQSDEAVRVEVVQEVLVLSIRVRIGKEVVVEPDLSVGGGGGSQ